MHTEPLFLTFDEVSELTGFKTPARQVQWFSHRGWRFEINGNRRPIVARKYTESMLGCGHTSDVQPIYTPNFEKLQARNKG